MDMNERFKVQKAVNQTITGISRELENETDKVVQEVAVGRTKGELQRVEKECGILKKQVRRFKLARVLNAVKKVGSSVMCFLSGGATVLGIQALIAGNWKGGLMLALGAFGAIGSGLLRCIANIEHDLEKNEENQNKMQIQLDDKTNQKNNLEKQIEILEQQS